MDAFKTFSDIIDFAIKREEEASAFYTDVSKRMARPEMAKVFHEFADEELGHKRKLEAVKRGDYRFDTLDPTRVFSDMRIEDYVVADAAGPDISYQDALILAMKKEKKSFKLYTDLARMAKDGESQKLFASLAQEEAKHKLRFELEYDDVVMKED